MKDGCGQNNDKLHKILCLNSAETSVSSTDLSLSGLHSKKLFEDCDVKVGRRSHPSVKYNIVSKKYLENYHKWVVDPNTQKLPDDLDATLKNKLSLKEELEQRIF
jgi:vacuolar-type H+-ATPase catalytic subunit A/Vma1